MSDPLVDLNHNFTRKWQTDMFPGHHIPQKARKLPELPPP